MDCVKKGDILHDLNVIKGSNPHCDLLQIKKKYIIRNIMLK